MHGRVEVKSFAMDTHEVKWTRKHSRRLGSQMNFLLGLGCPPEYLSMFLSYWSCGSLRSVSNSSLRLFSENTSGSSIRGTVLLRVGSSGRLRRVLVQRLSRRSHLQALAPRNSGSRGACPGWEPCHWCDIWGGEQQNFCNYSW